MHCKLVIVPHGQEDLEWGKRKSKILKLFFKNDIMVEFLVSYFFSWSGMFFFFLSVLSFFLKIFLLEIPTSYNNF